MSAEHVAEALAEIEQATVASLAEVSIEVSEAIVSVAKNIAQQLAITCDCAVSVDHDDGGGLELYLKKGQRAILITLGGDTLTYYEDRKATRWRAKYELDSALWRAYLSFFLEQFNTAE